MAALFISFPRGLFLTQKSSGIFVLMTNVTATHSRVTPSITQVETTGLQTLITKLDTTTQQSSSSNSPRLVCRLISQRKTNSGNGIRALNPKPQNPEHHRCAGNIPDKVRCWCIQLQRIGSVYDSCKDHELSITWVCRTPNHQIPLTFHLNQIWQTTRNYLP